MRILVALVLLSLTACPPKKPAEPTGDAAGAGDPVAVPEPRGSVTTCPGEPAWLAWTPCRADDALYVGSKVSGEGILAKTRALTQARATLVRLGVGEVAGDGGVTLQGSEALDSFACEEHTWGLARWTGTPPTTLEVADCGNITMLSSDAADGPCPAWTRRGAWREDDVVFAVGAVKGISNRSLASTTARNRALAEASKVRASLVRLSDTEVSLRAASVEAGIPSAVEMAECDGVLYAKVQIAGP